MKYRLEVWGCGDEDCFCHHIRILRLNDDNSSTLIECIDFLPLDYKKALEDVKAVNDKYGTNFVIGGPWTSWLTTQESNTIPYWIEEKPGCWTPNKKHPSYNPSIKKWLVSKEDIEELIEKYGPKVI